MRPVNLLVLAQGFDSVPPELSGAFEAQLSEREEPLSIVKSHEAESVVRLAQALWGCGMRQTSDFEGFVFSFRIPQISSEFDLLKITDDAVVNIELKSEYVGMRRISEQLVRNKYYLSPLERVVYTFTFVSDSGRLYEQKKSETTREVGIERLVAVLQSVGKVYKDQVEDLFQVSNYLVSPLNDARKFLEGHYFLTNHQAQIKASFLKACALDDGAREATAPTYMVYGGAGTGKSLLLYDLARSWNGVSPACVIHCGVLCEGHGVLNEGQAAFRVISAKGLERVNLADYGALYVDEAQRMWPSQLKRVVSVAAAKDMPLYLSLDRRQILPQREEAYDIESIVGNMRSRVSIWELSHKIRTNRGLADFIRALFSLPGAERYAHTNRVKVANAADTRMARELVDAFRGVGYQFISLGMVGAENAGHSHDELSIPGSPDPYAVVGQEFDKVVMAVGPCFSLSEGTHRQLLYQGLTRARSRIALVIYRNEAFLRKLLCML